MDSASSKRRRFLREYAPERLSKRESKASADKDEQVDSVLERIEKEEDRGLRSEARETTKAGLRLKKRTYEQALEKLEHPVIEETEESFFSGNTFTENLQTVQELEWSQLYLFMVLGMALDRLKKLKPVEQRSEMRALVKMVKLRDPNEIESAFFNGFKFSAEMQKKYEQRVRAAESGPEKAKIILEMFTELTGKASSVSVAPQPFYLVIDSKSGKAAPGEYVELHATAYGGKRPFEMFLANRPEWMEVKCSEHEVTMPAPGIRWTVRFCQRIQAKEGEYPLTLTVKDAGGKEAIAHYSLTVVPQHLKTQ